MSDVVIPVRAPNGYADIIARFGDPRYMANGSVDPNWEMGNMVIVRDLPMVSRLYVNRQIVDPLRRALSACQALGDGYKVETIGCFAPRAQRGSNGLLLSAHTWGIAVDINADRNKLIAPCYADDPRRTEAGACDIPVAWVQAFKDAGFMWGGDFSHRFDPMHFQFCTGY